MVLWHCTGEVCIVFFLSKGLMRRDHDNDAVETHINDMMVMLLLLMTMMMLMMIPMLMMHAVMMINMLLVK